jgi:DNA-binding TFAR19-related protein (PDSD5 family)
MSFPDSDESQEKPPVNEEEFNAQKENILKQILSSEARMFPRKGTIAFN